MNYRLFYAWVIAILGISLSYSASGYDTHFDYLFLIDTSGSMEGRPAGRGNENIFPAVKEAINSFLDTIEEDATVVIMPFHKDVHREFSVTIQGKADRERVKEYVRELDAPGQVTWIYYSLRTALQKAKAMRSQADLPRVQTLLLYTDGHDNGPQDLSLDKILSSFSLQRSENEHLYLKYITLGVELAPAERTLLTKTPGVSYEQTPRGKVSPIYLVEVRPAVLDFGNLWKEDGSERDIRLNCSPTLAGTTVQVELILPTLEELGVLPTIKPGALQLEGRKDQLVTLNLRLRNPLPEGSPTAFEGQLVLRGLRTMVFAPEAVTVRLNITPDQIVTILPEEGNRLEKDFGILSLARKDPISLAWSWRLSFNRFAQQTGLRIQAEVEQERGNPSTLPDGSLTLETDHGLQGRKLMVTPAAKILTLHLSIPASGVTHGRYFGRVALMAEDGIVEGNGLRIDESRPEEQFVRFQFTVPPPGWYTWLRRTMIAAGVLVLLVLVWLWRRTFRPG